MVDEIKDLNCLDNNVLLSIDLFAYNIYNSINIISNNLLNITSYSSVNFQSGGINMNSGCASA